MSRQAYEDGVLVFYEDDYPQEPVVISTDPRDHPLTPYQFRVFTIANGYDVAITGLLTALKELDMFKFAVITAKTDALTSYSFEALLGLVTDPDLVPLIPAGTDVTEATLSARWMAVKDL